MLATNFGAVISRVLAHEGGYSNHPKDPGGPTNYGITLATYRQYINWSGNADDVRKMSVFEARKIYRNQYWNAIRGDELPSGVDYSVFDYAVNSGQRRAGKVLRRVCGLPDGDGKVTDDVLSAIRKREPAALTRAINEERVAFLKSLKTWPTFGKGWSRRVADVKSVSLALAGQSTSIRPIEPAPGKGEVSPAPTGAVVKGGGAVTAGGSAWAWLQSPEAVAALIVGGVIVIGVAVYFIRRARDRRQDAVVPFAVVPENT